ncbi:MAG: hypothetical protein HY815_20070 [Candidatus Riflebacteria bacterium]|nr:hypothetical protein [Candidatus Riflebacteria bacterium]
MKRLIVVGYLGAALFLALEDPDAPDARSVTVAPGAAAVPRRDPEAGPDRTATARGRRPPRMVPAPPGSSGARHRPLDRGLAAGSPGGTERLPASPPGWFMALMQRYPERATDAPPAPTTVAAATPQGPRANPTVAPASQPSGQRPSGQAAVARASDPAPATPGYAPLVLAMAEQTRSIRECVRGLQDGLTEMRRQLVVATAPASSPSPRPAPAPSLSPAPPRSPPAPSPQSRPPSRKIESRRLARPEVEVEERIRPVLKELARVQAKLDRIEREAPRRGDGGDDAVSIPARRPPPRAPLIEPALASGPILRSGPAPLPAALITFLGQVARSVDEVSSRLEGLEKRQRSGAATSRPTSRPRAKPRPKRSAQAAGRVVQDPLFRNSLEDRPTIQPDPPDRSAGELDPDEATRESWPRQTRR